MKFQPVSKITLIAICASMLVCGKSMSANSLDVTAFNGKKLKSNSCIFAPVQATSVVKINMNLNANSIVPSDPFNPSDNSTYNFQANSELYDSLGVQNNLQLFYIKNTVNGWIVHVFVNGTLIGTGKLQFDAAGILTTADGLNQLSWTPTNGATSPQLFSIDMLCTTQFGYDFEIFSIWQNGHTTIPSFHAALNAIYFSSHKNASDRMCFNEFSHATTTVKLHINLDAKNSIPSSPFDPKDIQSYNYTINMWIYDSLGAPYKLSLYYVKNSVNVWKVYAYMYRKSLGSGQLVFNSNGTLTNVTGLDELSWLPYSGADSPQIFGVDMTCSTQYGSPNKLVEAPWQDGQPSGFSTHPILAKTYK